MTRALLRYRLGRLRGLRRHELAQLCRAQLTLLWAAALVYLRPAGRLVSTSAEAAAAPVVATPPPLVPPAARSLERAVERAARHGVFRPTCLVKSVALQRMLEAAGVQGSRIRIGVRLRDGEFFAHAWVEWHGVVLGDTPDHIGDFDPLCQVNLPTRR